MSANKYCKTYLSDPLEWLGGQLDTIKTKESDGSTSRDSDHEKFIVLGGLDFLNRMASKDLAILTKVNITCLILIVNIDQ